MIFKTPIRFIGLFALGLLLSATFLMAGPPRAEALTNCTVSDADLTFDTEEQSFLTLINQYRAQNGAGPLTASANLNRAAAWMSRDLVNRSDPPQHVDTLGRDPFVRMAQCDAVAPGALLGENIAGGFAADAAGILAQWKASPEHDATMKDPRYVQIGIARANNPANQFPWQWTTDFSTVDDGTRAGQPTTPVSTPQTNIESPAAGNVPSSFPVTGWAIDRGATANAGVDQVHVYIYQLDGNNNPIQPQVFFSPAVLGDRPDIANGFGQNFLHSGFSVTTSTLPPAKYQIAVYAHSMISGNWNATTRNVTVQGPQSNPLMTVDSPAGGNTPGSFP